MSSFRDQLQPVLTGFLRFFAVPVRGSCIMKLSGTGPVRGPSKKAIGPRLDRTLKHYRTLTNFLKGKAALAEDTYSSVRPEGWGKATFKVVM